MALYVGAEIHECDGLRYIQKNLQEYGVVDKDALQIKAGRLVEEKDIRRSIEIAKIGELMRQQQLKWRELTGKNVNQIEPGQKKSGEQENQHS